MRWELVDEHGDPTLAAGQSKLFDPGRAPDRHVGSGEFAGMEFLHVNAKTIINEVPIASRMPFRYTINAYRGCSHACSYCFARPTHTFLGLNIDDDFERRIVVKVNAVERLRAELARADWVGDHLAMGTNTDPYQPCEGKYHLTQGIVRVLIDARNPFSILTKSTLVLRDIKLLSEAAAKVPVQVNLSIGTLDEEVWRLSEPGTPPPAKRVEAVRRLNAAGVPCGVLIAPVLPGLSDRPDQLQAVVDAVVGAGATSVSSVLLYLREGFRSHFLSWLAIRRPDLVDEYERLYKRAELPRSLQKEHSELIGNLVREARSKPGAPKRIHYAGGSFRNRVDQLVGDGPATVRTGNAPVARRVNQLDLGL